MYPVFIDQRAFLDCFLVLCLSRRSLSVEMSWERVPSIVQMKVCYLKMVPPNQCVWSAVRYMSVLRTEYRVL